MVRTYGNESNHEEPHSQYPEEQGSDDGQGADQFTIQKTIALYVEVLWKSVGHTDKCQASERRWANSNKHGSTVLAVWVSDLHEATDIMSIHENGDRESETLTSKTCHKDGVSGSQWLIGCNDGGNSS